MVDSSKMPADGTAKPAVFLLDTMSFIFRAYHAMQRQRPMSTRTGIPTSAVYVFVNMLDRLRKEFSPQYLAAVFDVSAPLLREEQAKALTLRKYNSKTQQFEEVEYAGYKANREATPADLVQQLPYIRRALDALRIPIVQYEGYEADDVIGTLARQAAAAGHPVYIVSSDKDMMQLVDEQVRVLNPAKDNLVLDRAGVVATLGVQPEQVVDVMALRGDAIDNVPGAPGIGDKGSVELVQQFGSVEAVLEHASEVKRKSYRESLENNRDTILLSKELVTIHTSVPVPLDLQQMRTQPPDVTACRELFSELEFTSFLKALGAQASESAQSSGSTQTTGSAPPTQYLLDPSDTEIEALLTAARTQGLALAYATENAAEEDAGQEEGDNVPHTMSLLDVAGREEKPVQGVPMILGLATAGPTKALRTSLADQRVRAALEDAELPKSVHDLKTLLRRLEQQDIALAGVRDDLMLYSYLVNPTHGSHRLEDVVARFGNQPLSTGLEERLPEAAAAIARLAPVLRKDLETAQTLNIYESMDLPLVPVLLRMEQAGIRIDRRFLESMSSRLNASMHALGEKIFMETGQRFNINSPKQLGDILFNKMGLPKPMKYGRGKVTSTAQDVLEELSEHHAVPRLVLEYRQLAKLKSTYTDSLPLQADAQGRVHTTFNQTGTATGRLSSNNPNVQNIPVRTELGREIRAAFVPAPGNILLSADYSQIELRLMAHFSDDPLLLKAYRENEDIHTLTASEVFGVPAVMMDKETRNRAKAVNFGIVYGISPFGLAQQLGITQGDAQRYIQRYFERYHGVRAFIDRTLEEVRRDQCVRTLFGRVRPIPDITSRNANQRGFAERTAINTPLQGTAADILKLAMVRIDREMRGQQMRSQMVLQVHDELVFDVVPEELATLGPLVREAMEHIVELKVPLVADLASGPNWRDLK
ncbi:MAG: DNA polymerase I [Acidobacteriaceae bacterium]